MCLEVSKNVRQVSLLHISVFLICVYRFANRVCKTRARAHRWREECKLLKVEMDRVKRTLEHDANLWLSHAKSAAEGVALINAGEGAGAYAKRQAAIRTSIRLSFEEKWRFVGQWLELGETVTLQQATKMFQ